MQLKLFESTEQAKKLVEDKLSSDLRIVDRENKSVKSFLKLIKEVHQKHQ